MRKSFKFGGLANFSLQDPASLARLVIAFLLLLNLVAAYLVMKPPGGSPNELIGEVQGVTSQLQQKRQMLERTRLLMSKIQSGREQGDVFLGQYFLPASTAYSTVYSEILDLAKTANITAKESTYAIEPVEGSDTLSMMTISQNLEGAYKDLIHFVNALDKSSGLLIVESLTATPQNSGNLTVVLKLQTYIREDGAPANGAGQ